MYLICFPDHVSSQERAALQAALKAKGVDAIVLSGQVPTVYELPKVPVVVEAMKPLSPGASFLESVKQAEDMKAFALTSKCCPECGSPELVAKTSLSARCASCGVKLPTTYAALHPWKVSP